MHFSLASRTWWLLAIGASLLASPASSQPNPGSGPETLPPMGSFAHQAWGADQGLPQSTVRALLQTRDGYLWVSTHAGLARFDGLTFTIFDVANTPALQSDRVYSLYEDRHGTLWIGTEGGLTRYSDGTFTSVPLLDEPAQPMVSAIREDRAGRLWIGTSRGLYWRDGDRLTHVALPNPGVCCLVVDRHDDVWAGTHQGLARVHNGTLARFYTASDGLADPSVLSLGEGRDGTLWVGTMHRLFRLSGDRFVPEPPNLPGWRGAIFQDRDGTLWAGEGRTLTARDATGALRTYELPTDVLSIAQDREGHLWFGTRTGPGLHRLTPHRVTLFGRPQGLPCDNAAVVTEGLDGTIWLGTNCAFKGLVALYRDGRIEADMARDGHPALALVAARDGGIWVASWGQGVRVLKDGRITRYLRGPGKAPEDTPSSDIIPSLYEDAAGAVWAGSTQGVSRFWNNRWQHYRVADGIVPGIVWFITGDAEGTMWFGASGGVSRLKNGTFTNYTKANGLSHNEVRALHVDGRALWIGTVGGGLSRLEEGRFTHYTTTSGLFENTVLRILDDDRGHLWLTGNRGITRVSRASLAGVAAGTRKVLDAVLFGKADGLTDPECVGGGQTAGWKMRDGSLWIPTMAGVARIDPGAIAPNRTPPPIGVEQVTIDDVAYAPRGSIEAPPGAGDVEIRYTGLSLAAPDRNRFKYKLEGYDPDWVEADTRRVAYYTRLPPAAYRFHVIGSNSDGVWNEAGATLAFSLQPRWYQRRATHVLAALALIALAIGGHRFRLRQLTRRNTQLEARVAERTAAIAAQREQLAHTNAQLQDAHALLQSNHEQMVSMLAQLRLGLIVIDDEGMVMLANDVVCGLLNVTPREAQALDWERLLPLSEDDRSAIGALLQHSQAGRRVAVRLGQAGGREHAAEVEVQRDPDAPGRRVIFLHEITEVCRVDPLASATPRFNGLYGESTAMRVIRRHIEEVAPVDATILIEGETGTGKELVARALHAASGRRHKPLVAVNCAGLTESLLASQLFGHRRGAFTDAVADHVGLFEAAQGGTIFLDEIGDMPLGVQTSLLRVLQEREILRLGDSRPRKIDVRVVAATHRHLEEEVREGRFRQDLFYRVCVTRIAVPPLRDRREDIPLLAAVFLREMRTRAGKPRLELAQEVVDAFGQYDWPGNVRQLRSAIESAVVRAKEPVVRLADLPFEVAGLYPPFASARATLKEQQFVIDALRTAGGNRSLAARLLGISRSTLYRRIASLAGDGSLKMDEIAENGRGDADRDSGGNGGAHAGANGGTDAGGEAGGDDRADRVSRP